MPRILREDAAAAKVEFPEPRATVTVNPVKSLRVLIASDKFRDALSAAAACEAIAAGVRSAASEASVIALPIADGGEGFAEAMRLARGGRIVTQQVTGPLPEMRVRATFAILNDGSAVIEMSAVAGLAMLPTNLRDPMATTSFGVGELIIAAKKEGCRKIILGLGGSATVDAGIGCAQATGHTVVMEDGEPVSMSEPLCGRDLLRVVTVKRHRGEMSDGLEIIAAVDTRAVLSGENGAACLFGPQKGATPADVKQLDAAMAALATRAGYTREAALPGAGAAGGLGFALAAYYGGTLQSGIDLLLDAADFDAKLREADLVITGEGSLDATSLTGKSIAGIAARCRQAGVPCIALAGRVQGDLQLFTSAGITAALAIADGPMSLDESLARCSELLTRAAANVTRLFAIPSLGTPGEG